jgi:hypothetical protein
MFHRSNTIGLRCIVRLPHQYIGFCISTSFFHLHARKNQEK